MTTISQNLQALGKSPASAAPGDVTPLETHLTIGHAIRTVAALHPEQPAIISSRFPPLGYGDLHLQLDEFRSQLRRGGFTCGDRIGVLMPNGPEAVLAILGVACSATAVPFDPRQTPEELNGKLEALHLDALLVLRDGFPEASSIAAQRNLTIIEAAPVEDGRLGLTLVLPTSTSPAPEGDPTPDTPAFILQTSGTTAQPKLIPFTHANMLAAAARLKIWFGLTCRDRCLSVSPPFYSHGLKVTVFTPLLSGGSIAIPADPTAVDLPEWFDGLRPTWYSAGPALHRAVLDQAKGTDNIQSMHTLRFVVSGGAPLPGGVREALQNALGIPVLEHYGLSEAAQIAANLPPPGLNRPGTCGRPWPGTVMIAGEDGNKLPPGEQGEVWVRGPTLTSGYLGAPGINRDAFVDGWFRTGDLGSLDKDGFLLLHGRLAEVINRGGEKIAPAEIDAALLSHPAVAEAASFAVPHPRLGEDVAAAVVLRPEASATPSDLRRFLQDKLTSFKIPRRIEIRDQLPKGVTGKIQRRRLAEAASADGKTSVSSHPRNLEADLLQLWRRLLGSETLTIDDDFFESGGDSLLATGMLIEAERLVGRRIPETIMFEAATIRQIVATLTAEPEQTAVSRARSHRADDPRPLFFFHGDFNNGALQIRKMVRLLGSGQPIIPINPHGLHGEAIPASFEEMAAACLPQILERQANGPFLLGGKCNGAMVAFETARLLVAAGHKVDMVAMVDPPTVCARPVMRTILRIMRLKASPLRVGWAYDQMARLERFFSLTPMQALAKMRRLAPMKILERAYVRLFREDFTLGPSTTWEAYSIAMSRYLPAPLDVPVVFYAATHHGRSWSRMSPNVEVVEVPGGHDHCLTIGAKVIVSDLQQRIARLSTYLGKGSERSP
ncbi:AMP-binding protein [Microvirga mediterraneensis]|uniref:AMP-binding protein n=1 Tax=Microvirga mediterraneensis TaxID=2754695 RepID=UPI0031B5706B